MLASKTVNKWAWQAVQFCPTFWSEQNQNGRTDWQCNKTDI